MTVPSPAFAGRAIHSVDIERPQHPHHKPHHRHSLGAMPASTDSNIDLDMLLQDRHSAPLLPRTSLTLKDTPESVLMHTSVHFTGVTRRDDHCVYAMEVSTGYATHVIHKRYSEIRAFRKEMLRTLTHEKTHCGTGPCAQLRMLTQVQFPRRKLKLPTRDADLELAYERQLPLERFLQVMLRVYRMTSRRHMRLCVNANCVAAETIKKFLQVTDGGPASMSPRSSSNSSSTSDNEVDTINTLNANSPTAITYTNTVNEPPTAVAVSPSKLTTLRPTKSNNNMSNNNQVWLYPIYEDPEHVLTSTN